MSLDGPQQPGPRLATPASTAAGGGGGGGDGSQHGPGTQPQQQEQEGMAEGDVTAAGPDMAQQSLSMNMLRIGSMGSHP